MKKFTFYWLDGTKAVLEGTSEMDAFNKAGYGRGALRALDFITKGEDNSYSWSGGTWKKNEPIVIKEPEGLNPNDKTLPITTMFQGLPIGQIRFYNIEVTQKLLSSGQYTFAGSYRRHKDGTMELMELSLIPIEMKSTLNLLKGEKDEGNNKGIEGNMA